MATVVTRSPTSRSISIKILADRFNESLPRFPAIYLFHGAKRLFLERREGAGLYDDTIAELEVLYPDSDFS